MELHFNPTRGTRYKTPPLLNTSFTDARRSKLLERSSVKTEEVLVLC